MEKTIQQSGNGANIDGTFEVVQKERKIPLCHLAFCPKQLHLVIYSRHVGVVAILKMQNEKSLLCH